MEPVHRPDDPPEYPFELRSLSDIRMMPDGSLFAGWRLLPESFRRSRYPRPSSWEELRWHQKIIPWVRLFIVPYFRRCVPERAATLSGEYFFVSQQWGKCYYHWLIDHVATLFVLRRKYGERPLQLLLTEKLAKRAFVRETLALLHMEPVVIRRPLFLPALQVATAKGVEDIFHAPTLQELRNMFREEYGPFGEEGRVYISRSLANKRRVVNEEEILPVLQKHRFRVYHFERLPFAEQVRLAAGASALMGPHGAGLANMLFLPPESPVLELRPHAFRNDCFVHVAQALGHRHSLLEASEALPHHDMRINPQELDALLTRILG